MKVHPEETCRHNSPMASSFPFFSSFSYNKIADQPLKFTILKLDGSTFDIEVARNRTVAELKNAVEAEFSHLEENGAKEVSWSHVWGQFCLSYNGKQLLTDSDFIENHGIKDGAKLEFTRQESIAQSVTKQSDAEDPDLSDGNEDRLPVSKQVEDYNSEGSIEGDEKEENEECDGKNTLVYFLRKWFSYSRNRAKQQGWDGGVRHQDYALVSQEIV